MQFVTTGVESLSRRISLCGLMSRGEAERAIKQGIVSVDGRTVTHGMKVADSSSVYVNGITVPAPSVEPLLFGLIKPRGYLSEYARVKDKQTLFDLLDIWAKRGKRDFGPRGLDELGQSKMNHLVVVNQIPAKATGLVLLTNDGLFSKSLLSPSSKILTTFRIRVGNLTDTQIEDIRKWKGGVSVAGIDYGPIFTDVEKRTPTQTWLKVRFLFSSGDINLNDLFWYRAGIHVNRINCHAFGPYVVSDLPDQQLVRLPIHGNITHLIPKREIKPTLLTVPS